MTQFELPLRCRYNSRQLYDFEPVLAHVPRAHGQRAQPGSIDFSPAVCPECPVCAVLCCAVAPMSFAWCMRIFHALPSALTLAMAQRQSGISLPIRFRFCFPYQLTQFRNTLTSISPLAFSIVRGHNMGHSRKTINTPKENKQTNTPCG